MSLESTYAALVDSVFHLNRPPESDAIAPGYRSHDPFLDRGAGIDGVIRAREQLFATARSVRYDIMETFATPTKLAARYVATGVKASGEKFVAHGLSINHAGARGFTEGWTLNDYRDLGHYSDAAPSAAAVSEWDGTPIRTAPDGSRLAAYLALVDIVYGRREVSQLGHLVDERYVSQDPFVARASGRAGIERFHARVLELFVEVDYRVVDAVEVGDRLAVRYVARGIRKDSAEPLTVLGMSINHFERGLMRRGWVMNHYAGMSASLEAR